MSINPAQAANAYLNTAIRNVENSQNIDAGIPANETNAASFADLMTQSSADAISTLQQGENVSLQALTGKADVTDVVMAVNNAEITLQAVVAIRDRVIQSYQQIMNMPI